MIVSAVGLGGLDDVTRAALKLVGNAGLLVLKPVLLALGFLAGALVGLFNWISGWFGGGDLTSFDLAQEQFREFHEQLEQDKGDGGLPEVVKVLLKAVAFLAAAGAALWLLYRIFRFRRLLRRTGEVEETRQSLFSWSRANRDLSALLADWWNSLPAIGGRGGKRPTDPASPRDFYHELLALTARLGHPRREWETPKQHQGSIRDLLPNEPVSRIVDAFQISHYGQVAPSRGELTMLRQDWEAITGFSREAEPGG